MRLTRFTDFGPRPGTVMAGEPNRAFSTAEFAQVFAISRNQLTKPVMREADG